MRLLSAFAAAVIVATTLLTGGCVTHATRLDTLDDRQILTFTQTVASGITLGICGPAPSKETTRVRASIELHGVKPIYHQEDIRVLDSAGDPWEHAQPGAIAGFVSIDPGAMEATVRVTVDGRPFKYNGSYSLTVPGTPR